MFPAFAPSPAPKTGHSRSDYGAAHEGGAGARETELPLKVRRPGIAKAEARFYTDHLAQSQTRGHFLWTTRHRDLGGTILDNREVRLKATRHGLMLLHSKDAYVGRSLRSLR